MKIRYSKARVERVAAAIIQWTQEKPRPCVVTVEWLAQQAKTPRAAVIHMIGKGQIGDLYVALGGRRSWGTGPVYDATKREFVL